MVVATLNLNFILVVTTNLKLKKEGFEMSEKEIKKIDEKGEEKISGGAKIDGKKIDAKEIAKILDDAQSKVFYPALAYGFVTPYGEINKILKKRREEARKAQDSKDALATSQPQDGEKK